MVIVQEPEGCIRAMSLLAPHCQTRRAMKHIMARRHMGLIDVLLITHGQVLCHQQRYNYMCGNP